MRLSLLPQQEKVPGNVSHWEEKTNLVLSDVDLHMQTVTMIG